MTLQELELILLNTGYPVEHNYFKKPPDMPYILYLITNSSNFGADNKVYQKINHCKIELYTNKKDLEAEQILENVFDNASIFYDKTESYIDSERFYQVVYEISI